MTGRNLSALLCSVLDKKLIITFARFGSFHVLPLIAHMLQALRRPPCTRSIGAVGSGKAGSAAGAAWHGYCHAWLVRLNAGSCRPCSTCQTARGKQVCALAALMHELVAAKGLPWMGWDMAKGL
eukprot:1161393-Pelagomonas_calceolata.AAC.10